MAVVLLNRRNLPYWKTPINQHIGRATKKVGLRRNNLGSCWNYVRPFFIMLLPCCFMPKHSGEQWGFNEMWGVWQMDSHKSPLLLARTRALPAFYFAKSCIACAFQIALPLLSDDLRVKANRNCLHIACTYLHLSNVVLKSNANARKSSARKSPSRFFKVYWLSTVYKNGNKLLSRTPS